MRYKLNNRKVLFVNNDDTYILFQANVKRCNCGTVYVTKNWKSGIETLYGIGIREELGRRSIRVSPVKRGCADCAVKIVAQDAYLRRRLGER